MKTTAIVVEKKWIFNAGNIKLDAICALLKAPFEELESRCYWNDGLLSIARLHYRFTPLNMNTYERP